MTATEQKVLQRRFRDLLNGVGVKAKVVDGYLVWWPSNATDEDPLVKVYCSATIRPYGTGRVWRITGNHYAKAVSRGMAKMDPRWRMELTFAPSEVDIVLGWFVTHFATFKDGRVEPPVPMDSPETWWVEVRPPCYVWTKAARVLYAEKP